jgi:isochorismate hydrolase
MKSFLYNRDKMIKVLIATSVIAFLCLLTINTESFSNDVYYMGYKRSVEYALNVP